MYECPRCHQLGIPGWRRWSLGPAVPARCRACGGLVTVPWRSMVSVVPFLGGILLAVATDSFVGSTAFVLAGAALMFFLYARTAPLVPK
jgi:hypothetical protein